jgi:hypothetical protein
MSVQELKQNIDLHFEELNKIQNSITLDQSGGGYLENATQYFNNEWTYNGYKQKIEKEEREKQEREKKEREKREKEDREKLNPIDENSDSEKVPVNVETKEETKVEEKVPTKVPTPSVSISSDINTLNKLIEEHFNSINEIINKKKIKKS